MKAMPDPGGLRFRAARPGGAHAIARTATSLAACWPPGPGGFVRGARAIRRLGSPRRHRGEVLPRPLAER